MSEKIFIQRWFAEIHPMDHHGSAHYRISGNGHEITVAPHWFNCGEIIEVAKCSCGFTSVEAPGNGCWQQGHNEPSEHEFDELHAEMYAAIEKMELAEMQARLNPHPRPRRRSRK